MKREKKERKRKPRNKKLPIVSLVLGGLVVGLAIFAYIVFFFRSDIPLKMTEINLEYGENLVIEREGILETNDQNVINSLEIDVSAIKYVDENEYPEVGEYIVPIKYIQKRKDQVKEISVKITDSTAPEFSKFTDLVEYKKGESKPDFSKVFLVKDLSETTVSVDDKAVNYSKVGEYEVTVTAKDQYDNSVSKKAKVKVIEVAVAPSPPSGETGGGGQLTYVSGILVVNKKHGLPSSYAPGEDPTAGHAARRMIADMQNAGMNISNSYSGFRNYNYQARLYQGYVSSYGQASADTFSARPGFSEHQTGLAFDLLHRDGQLVTGATEVNWIANNAHKYGFIVRYKAGKESITGYQAEPWHLRYIGDRATAIWQSGLTLEEYLSVPGGSYY